MATCKRPDTHQLNREDRTEMMRSVLQTILAAIALTAASTALAAEAAPDAEFLFVGSYHMGNPGQDAHNMQADDVTSERRQGEIREVARMLEAYKPTKVMVEVDTAKQGELQQRFDQSCGGSRALTRNEVHDHLKRALAGGRWAKLRGLHVLRHSYVSALAAAGVADRLRLAAGGCCRRRLE